MRVLRHAPCCQQGARHVAWHAPRTVQAHQAKSEGSAPDRRSAGWECRIPRAFSCGLCLDAAPLGLVGFPDAGGPFSKDINMFLVRSAVRLCKRLLAETHKAHPFKHANRARIVPGHPCNQRACNLHSEKEPRCRGRNPATPELPTQPIAKQALAGRGICPRANMSDHTLIQENGPVVGGGISQDMRGPMGKKRRSTPRWKRGHPRCLGIQLMGEEDLQIARVNRSQRDGSIQAAHECPAWLPGQLPARVGHGDNDGCSRRHVMRFECPRSTAHWNRRWATP